MSHKDGRRSSYTLLLQWTLSCFLHQGDCFPSEPGAKYEPFLPTVPSARYLVMNAGEQLFVEAPQWTYLMLGDGGISALCPLTVQPWPWSHERLRWAWRAAFIPILPSQTHSILVYGWEPSWVAWTGESGFVRGQHNLGNQSPGVSARSQQVLLLWDAKLCHKTLTSERYELEFISHANSILIFSQWFPKISLRFTLNVS